MRTATKVLFIELFIVLFVLATAAVVISTATGKAEASTRVVINNCEDEFIHHDGTPDRWYNFAPNADQGPLDSPPEFPLDERGYWQGPHEEGGPQQDTYGLFQTGNGHGDWFFRTPGIAPVDEPNPFYPCETEPPEEDPTDYCDSVVGVQDENFNCPPAENPEKPVRYTKCVGTALLVTVEFPNGNIEKNYHEGHKLCRDTDDPVAHSVGSPKRLATAPDVAVVEEGM